MSIPTKTYGPEFLADLQAPEGGPELIQRLRFLASGQDDVHSVALDEAANALETLTALAAQPTDNNAMGKTGCFPAGEKTTAAPAEGDEITPAGYNRPPSGEPCNSADWNAGYEAGLADGHEAGADASKLPIAWMYEHDGCHEEPILTLDRWPECGEPWNETPLDALALAKHAIEKVWLDAVGTGNGEHSISEAARVRVEFAADALKLGLRLPGALRKTGVETPVSHAPQPKGMVREPVYADPLTQAIQRLNSNVYNLTKDECIQVIRELRDELRAAPDEALLKAVTDRLHAPGHLTRDQAEKHAVAVLETIAARAAEPDLCQNCGDMPHPGCNSEFSAEPSCRFWGPGAQAPAPAPAGQAAADYQAMFLDAARALAEIDATLGLPEDGCNDPQVTVSALKDYVAGAQEVARSRDQWVEAQYATAAIESPAVVAWQSVETPPVERMLCLVRIGDQTHIAQFDPRMSSAKWWHPYGVPSRLYQEPTHWTPLPEAPAGSQS